MKLRPATAVGAVAVVAALLPAGPAIAAGSATVSGRLAGGTAKLPKSASKGEAQVLAMNIDTAAYGGASEVNRRGRYKLRLPAGKWMLRSSVVALGKPFVSFTSAAIATRSGQRRTLPITLKRFKKPRRRVKRRRPARRAPSARVANVNPRDGRPYPGEAFAFEKFSVVGGDSDFAALGDGVVDMLTTDLMGKPKCEFSLVEWRKRDALLKEIALSQTEHVDPAAKIEAGHVIDPEIFIRGRVEDRPGTPRRLALIAWLVDAKTGARLSGDVSSVTLHQAFFASAERLAELIHRDLICARANAPAAPAAPAPAAPASGPPAPPSPPPSPPVPAAATDVYTGTFSGEAYSEGAFTRWTWSGTAVLDAAQDQGPTAPPPHGAPPGSYRTFTASAGSVEVTVAADPPGECALDGSGRIELIPGFLNQVIVQLDVPNPAYVIRIGGLGIETVPVTRSGGPLCTGTSPFPVFPQWASTGTFAHTSPSFALVGSHAELTPETPFDFDYTTRWSFAPD
jgi:hypothetical protein